MQGLERSMASLASQGHMADCQQKQGCPSQQGFTFTIAARDKQPRRIMVNRKGTASNTQDNLPSVMCLCHSDSDGISYDPLLPLKFQVYGLLFTALMASLKRGKNCQNYFKSVRWKCNKSTQFNPIIQTSNKNASWKHLYHPEVCILRTGGDTDQVKDFLL